MSFHGNTFYPPNVAVMRAVMANRLAYIAMKTSEAMEEFRLRFGGERGKRIPLVGKFRDPRRQDADGVAGLLAISVLEKAPEEPVTPAKVTTSAKKSAKAKPDALKKVKGGGIAGNKPAKSTVLNKSKGAQVLATASEYVSTGHQLPSLPSQDVPKKQSGPGYFEKLLAKVDNIIAASRSQVTPPPEDGFKHRQLHFASSAGPYTGYPFSTLDSPNSNPPSSPSYCHWSPTYSTAPVGEDETMEVGDGSEALTTLDWLRNVANANRRVVSDSTPASHSGQWILSIEHGATLGLLQSVALEQKPCGPTLASFAAAAAGKKSSGHPSGTHERRMRRDGRDRIDAMKSKMGVKVRSSVSRGMSMLRAIAPY
ncbi:hypothetical protein HDU96_010846 [Phlyctochytrium bullatum]|nr:hypothetical protein HDU96_010846 [Phlyctochytrium bullatum]